MACGCGRKSSPSRTQALRPSVGSRPQKTVSTASLRALGLQQQSVSLTEARQMDTQRRRIEKLKRDAIRKSLNK